jgi:hypothetical protein
LDQETDSAVKDQAFKTLLKIVEPSPVATKVLDEQAPKYVKSKNPDLKKVAYDYLERRANAGDPGAMMWMAYRFREGDSVDKDPAKAHDWLLKAALQNKNEKVKNLAFEALGETNHPPIPGTEGPSVKPNEVTGTVAQKYAEPVVAAPPAQTPKVIQSAPQIVTPPTAPSPTKAFVIPENATMNYGGHSWSCNPGYNPRGGECVAIVVPANATMNYGGHSWSCNPGFNPRGGECVAFDVPANATMNYGGHSWSCNPGYNPRNGECVPLVYRQ